MHWVPAKCDVKMRMAGIKILPTENGGNGNLEAKEYSAVFGNPPILDTWVMIEGERKRLIKDATGGWMPRVKIKRDWQMKDG